MSGWPSTKVPDRDGDGMGEMIALVTTITEMTAAPAPLLAEALSPWVHAETGQPPISRFEAGGHPPGRARPARRGVPLVGHPQGDPHRHRPAGGQRLRRRRGCRPPQSPAGNSPHPFSSPGSRRSKAAWPSAGRAVSTRLPAGARHHRQRACNRAGW